VGDDVAGAGVAVAGLADAADVDDGALFLDLVHGVVGQLGGRIEVGVVEEDAGLMGVADEADAGVEALEVGEDLLGVGEDVLGEDVLIHGAARGGVDEEDVAFLVAHGELAEEAPAGGAERGIGLGVEDVAGPVTGAFGGGVEIGGLVEDGVVVVAHDGGAAAGADEVDALARIRTIADDVAETDDLLDAALGEIVEDGLEGFEIGVNVADDGEHAFSGLASRAGGPSRVVPARAREYSGVKWGVHPGGPYRVRARGARFGTPDNCAWVPVGRSPTYGDDLTCPVGPRIIDKRSAMSIGHRAGGCAHIWPLVNVRLHDGRQRVDA